MVWHRVALILSVATLVLIAGCVAPASPNADRTTVGSTADTVAIDSDAGTTTGTGTGSTTGTGTGSTTGTGTGSTTGTNGAGVDPYGGETLVVGVENPVNGSRDFGPLVRRSLDYWEANASRYAGFDVSYRLDPDATDPDVVISVVERIEDCGSEDDHSAGCAPYITRPEQFSPPVRIRVVDGLSDESTVRVLIHELGHTLGLGHDDEPQSVMRAEGRLATLPRTDAVNRSYAWADSTLSVHVDIGVGAGDRAAVERQVTETLAYFDRGAEGTVPEDVSLVRTSNRSAADVVVQVGGTHPCDRDSGSCRRLRGLDPDADGRLETYDRLEVYVVGLEPEAVGWHVGRHLGHALGLTDDTEYPEPLRSIASYDERRSDWWE
jgi:hypothetical protein